MAVPFIASTLNTLKILRQKLPDDRSLQIKKYFADRLDQLKDRDEYSHIFRKKTRIELFCLTAAVCGIEFCYAGETAFVSPILRRIGVPPSFMTLVWCLSPLLGLFLVPLLGSMSDNCKSRFGRRRVFICLFSIGICLGLMLVPNGGLIAQKLANLYGSANSTAIGNSTVSTETESSKDIYYFGIFLTIIGVVILDFCCDGCQSPSRTYLLDVCIEEDHKRGLTSFTILAGIGGFFGYIIGGIDWGTATKISNDDSFLLHIRIVFGALMSLVCVLLTITSFREIPLEKLKAVETRTSPQEALTDAFPTTSDITKSNDYGYTDGTRQTVLNENKPLNQIYQGYDSDSQTFSYQYQEPVKQVVEIEYSEVSLKTYFKSIIYMPKSIFNLCVTNFFCWMSLVCYSLYFTDFVGQVIFNGDPEEKDDKRYEIGVRTGSFCMAVYSITCSFYSMTIEHLVSKLGAKKVYICSQLCYSLGMLILGLVKSEVMAFFLSATAGIMYATLFTMPYMILANYHAKQMFEEDVSANQTRGLGTDIALISSMVFFAQFSLSLVMGVLIEHFSPVVVIFAASLLSFCGAMSAFRVTYLDM